MKLKEKLNQKLDKINWSLIFETPKRRKEKRKGEEEEEEEEEEKKKRRGEKKKEKRFQVWNCMEF